MKNFTVCKMFCLHRKPAGKISQKNNALWICRQPSTCHFWCFEKQWDKDLYLGAVEAFLNTNQDIPFCCISKGGKHNCAKIKVVTTITNANRGRPFFVCSNDTDPCNYFAWGDQEIPVTPLCEHLRSSRMFTVKKEGLNKGRRFFRCGERDAEKRCKFFKWSEDVDEEIEKSVRCPLNSSADESKTVREEKERVAKR